MGRRLISLHDSQTLPGDLFQQFADKATAAGFGPTAAIARLLRRYLARGFDDGQAETQTPESAPRTTTTPE